MSIETKEPMCFVTPETKACVAEAEAFEAESHYSNHICGKDVKRGGISTKTFETALNNISEYLTDEEKQFYINFYQQHSTPKCCLPKGHSGPCMSSMTRYFADKFANKIKDCNITPGDDDIIYKNRASRRFPIQLSKAQYVVLNQQYKFKASGVKHKAAIPTEFGGTAFTIATAEYDFAAILMLQKGIEHTLPEDIEFKLLERAQEIIEEFAEQQIYITNDDGYLVDPILQCVIEPEWYASDNDGDFQVQFGHVNPISSTSYMTRGGNILPITRKANLIQSDSSIHQTYEYILKTAKLLLARGLSVTTETNT